MWESSRRRRSSGWPPRAVRVLALASTTSALSLANFQIITSTEVPSACILAYNTQISGCTTSDFTNGNQCSKACINGLSKEASIVQAICGGLDVNPESLLGLILDGHLLDSLCPGSTASTTTVKVTVQPSTSSKAASTTTTNARTSTVVTTSATIVTSIISSSTETTSSSAIINVPSQTITTSTSTTTDQVSQTTSSSSESTTTTQQAGATQGGGSPFDAVVQGKATGSATSRTLEALLAGLGIAFLVL